MELKPGHKQTEVGVIPEDWDALELEAVCTMKSGEGITASSIDDFSEYPCYGGNGLRGYTKRFTHDGRFALIGRQGALCGNVVTAQGKFFASEHAVVVSSRAGYDIDYLTYVLSEMHLNRYSESSAQPGLSVSKLLKLPLAAPREEAEQRSIAMALRNVDALLGELGNLIAKRRGIKQAAMQELLTGKRRLKGFGPTRSFKRYEYGLIPEDWNTELLRKISTMSGRIGWQGLKQEEFTDNPEDPFLITGMNFKEGKIDWSSVYHIPDKRYLEAPPIQLKPKDILMTKDGTIGKLLYVEAIPHPGKASLNSHLLVLRPVANMYAPEFLYYQLASPYFASHIEINKSGSTFFGLTQAAAGKYPVVLPSIDEQMAIGRALLSIDDAIDQLQHRLEKTQLLKAGILHELLTGRTRLK